MSEKGCESVSFGVFHISTVGFFILDQLRSKSIKLLSACLNQDLDLQYDYGQSRHGDNVPVSDDG